MKPMALWGGHEWSVVRDAKRYHDQTVLAGHQDRITDLDLVAGLGIKALRYPVLWERVAPDAPDALDLTWSDARLERICQLGMVQPAARPRDVTLERARDGLLSEALPAIDRFRADTRHAAKREAPQSPADLRDPVLVGLAGAVAQ